MIRLAMAVDRSHSVREGFMHAIFTWHIHGGGMELPACVH